MQAKRSITALLALGLVLSACGSNAAATQQPAGATQQPPAATTDTSGGGGGGGATQEPAATTDSGGGGGSGGGNPAGWDHYGKVHVEMGGPVNKTVDLGFVPAGSLFGSAQGSSLNFSNDGSNQVISILVGADNKVVVSYGGTDFSMPAADCTTSNWNIGATSASGSFDCKATLVILASGASVTNGTLKGSFDAHAT